MLFKCCKSTETVIQQTPITVIQQTPIDTQTIELVKPSAPPASDDSVTVESVSSDDIKTTSVTVESVSSDDIKTTSFDNESINTLLKQEEEPKLTVKQSFFPMKTKNLPFFGAAGAEEDKEVPKSTVKQSFFPMKTENLPFFGSAGAEEDKEVKTPFNCWGFNDRNNESSSNSSKYCGMFS